MGMVANASSSFMSPSNRTRDRHFHSTVMYDPRITGSTKQWCLHLIGYDSYAAWRRLPQAIPVRHDANSMTASGPERDR